ncbi:TetR/AcrR family transcriptional regulator [uncultured Thermanaerothrix sp.]|uniref:TetR/AcrR family transcriptional regulator n=1 Tax=uncultured Thermanaerothrix sp. TaxID=1195149 RepID=UPI0026357455|nr:TetR/AcrR family transcriptional regulator [uncultured Thermanaerothrix sp.]
MPKQERAEETRRRILEAARETFASQGYQATSVAEICQRAGVTKGAFFYHFPTKHTLFLALLEDWLAQLDQYLNSEHYQGNSVAQRLYAMADLLRLGLTQGRDYLPMFLEFWLQATRDPVVWQATIEPYRRYRTFFANLYLQGVNEGSLRNADPNLAAVATVSLALGLLLQGLMDRESINWDEAAPAAFRWVLSLTASNSTEVS